MHIYLGTLILLRRSVQKTGELFDLNREARSDPGPNLNWKVPDIFKLPFNQHDE